MGAQRVALLHPNHELVVHMTAIRDGHLHTLLKSKFHELRTVSGGIAAAGCGPTVEILQFDV